MYKNISYARLLLISFSMYNSKLITFHRTETKMDGV